MGKLFVISLAFMVSSLTLSAQVSILNNDTSICIGTSVLLKLKGLSYTTENSLVDQFFMKVDAVFDHSTPTFIGQDYFFIVTGNMNFFSGSCNDFDAFFKTVPSPAPFNVFSFNGGFVRPNPDIYRSNHDYRYDFIATTTQASFHFQDSYYRDNSCGLTFKVYRKKTVANQKYLWSMGDTTAAVSVSPKATTTYFVTITENNNSIKDSVKVIVNPTYEENKLVYITYGQQFIIGNDTLKASCLYKNTFSSITACDSTVNLSLKIIPALNMSDHSIVNDSIIDVLVGATPIDLNDSILSYQFDFDYNQMKLQYIDKSLVGTIAEGGNLDVKTIRPGHLQFICKSSSTISGIGAILKLQFKAIALGTTTPTITNAMFNNNPVKEITNGTITIAENPNSISSSGGVAINTDSSNSDRNAILDVKATDKGILIPRIDFNNRPKSFLTSGLLIFVIANGPQGNNAFYYYDGTDWVKLAISNK